MNKKYLLLFFYVLQFGLLHSSAEQVFQFDCEPYLQQLSSTEVTVMWTTNVNAISWVEIAPDDGSKFTATERLRFYDTTNGKKNIGTIHRVHLYGLQPATHYRYRIFSQEVTQLKHRDVRYGRTLANSVYKVRPYEFTTMDSTQKDIHFTVVNDIHENVNRFSSLFHVVDSASMNFMICNGDMVNRIDSLGQITSCFLAPASHLFAKTIPFYMVRGNHETRGVGSVLYDRLFPTNTGKSYYSFKYGEAFFIVLDSGEDKVDSDIEYNGLADYDTYRSEQAKWLKHLMESDNYKQARWHIVMVHIPPFGSDCHGALDIKDKFVSLFNEHHVDAVLSGHIHQHKSLAKGKNGCDFPILINSNAQLLDIHLSADTMTVDVVSENGAVKRINTITK